ncbi:MAG TPA: S8 family serine peptidase [Terriglobales bacterium]|nr:S8 family serine peptidase [Terriglobales bacterium]
MFRKLLACIIVFLLFGKFLLGFALAQDTGTPDSCWVEQKGGVQQNQVVALKVWAYNDETLGGFVVPLKFCSSPSTIYCDSVSFIGSRTSGYSFSGVSIDTAECSLVFYAIWTTGGLTPGSGLIATLYFRTTTNWNPDVGEVVDSTFYPPENHLEFTNASTGIGFTPKFKSGALGGVIEIIKPKKGSVWKEGETHDIAWGSVNFSGTVKVEYTTNSGQSWSTIGDNEPAQGQQSWIVPYSSTGKFTLKIANSSTGSPSQTVDGSTVDYIPGKLFVTFKDQSLPITLVNKSIGIAAVDSLINLYGVSDVDYLFKPDSSSPENISLYNSLNLGKQFIFKGPDTLDVMGLCNALTKQSSIEAAITVPKLKPHLSPCDSLYPQQWGLENPWHSLLDIAASDAWDLETGDTTVIVAIIDAGMFTQAMTHFQFCSYYYEKDNPNTHFDPIFEPYSYYNEGTSQEHDARPFFDDFNLAIYIHGTCLAGIIGAEADSLNSLLWNSEPVWKCSHGIAGIDQRVRLMPINIAYPYTCYVTHQCADYDADYAVRAIKRAADLGANVINMSWGLYDFPWSLTYINFYLKPAVQYAYSKGVVLVASMGNAYTGAEAQDKSPYISYPAAFPEVIAVGAIDSSGNRVTLATYPWESKRGTYIDLVAPGVNVLTTSAFYEADYTLFDGTSAAAPFVAGVAALLKAKRPELTNRQIKYILERSALDRIGQTDDGMGNLEDITGFDYYYGWGLVNALGALTAQVSFGRGDVNEDGVVSVTDAVYMVNYLFKRGSRPHPEKADTNCDGKVNVSDVVFLVNYLFKGGSTPCTI